MKKRFQTIAIILFTLLLMFADSIFNRIFGQAFIGLNAGNKNLGIQVGAISDKVEISGSYAFPYMANDKPGIATLQIGRQVDISENYFLLPAIGAGYLHWKDYTNYNLDPSGKTGIESKYSFNPLFGLQVGKNGRAGNTFLYANYCKSFYFGIGFKVYPSKL